MKKGNGNRGRQPGSENSKSLLVILAVVLVFLGGMLHSSMKLEARLEAYNARVEDLKERLETEENRTEEIDALKEYMKTDEFVEEAARERLGLVKDGEIVFVEGPSGEEQE